jgi:hypothetical protein
VARTAQASRLRALLLAGDDNDRRTVGKPLTSTALAALAGREFSAMKGRNQAVRQARSAVSRLRSVRCEGSSSAASTTINPTKSSTTLRGTT